MDQVTDSHDRVVPDHPWTGKTHHFPDSLPHIWFITMDGTVLAGGFFEPERAFCQSFLGIIPQLDTFLTKWISTVLLFTEYVDHGQQGGSLLFDIDHKTSKTYQ